MTTADEIGPPRLARSANTPAPRRSTQTVSAILLDLREQYAGHSSGVVLAELRRRFRRAGIDASPGEMERLAMDIARARP